MKTIVGIININLKQSKLAYLIVGIIFLANVVSETVSRVILHSGSGLALGNYLLILPLIMGVFIVTLNYKKLLNLDCKRVDFFKGCFPVYVIAAFCAALAGFVLWIAIDPLMLPLSSAPSLYNLFDVFGFAKNGEAVAFIQMFALLLLTSCAAHTLTLVQGHWYGWLADALIVAVIAVFTPIAPLRAALGWFLDLIVFNDLAIVQILSCAVLGVAVYMVGLIPIRTRQI